MTLVMKYKSFKDLKVMGGCLLKMLTKISMKV